MSDTVYLQCVNEKNKIRVRIISKGYNKNANCQFPRNLRVPGRKFSVPASSIKVASGRAGTFFYRVSNKSITIVNDEQIPNTNTQMPSTIYESETCCVCMDLACDIVMVDCGHLCMCHECSPRYIESTCPMCRSYIQSRIHKNQLE